MPSYTERLTSNEWLGPIGEEAEKVFSKLSREQAIMAAGVIMNRENDGNTDIPWTIIFPSDEVKSVGERLYQTIRTPDSLTPAYDLSLMGPIQMLDQILEQSGALDGQFTACHAAYHLVRVAAGKVDENFCIYTDSARRWPQYAHIWMERLQIQFGDRISPQIQPDLFHLLDQNQLLAKLSMQSSPPIQEEGESEVDLLTRAFDSIAITTGGNVTAEALAQAAESLSRRFHPYVAAAYAIRGLTLQK